MVSVERVHFAVRAQTASVDASVASGASVDWALSELAGYQRGVVERTQLLVVGFSASHVQRLIDKRRIHPLHRGVYAVGHRALTREGAWFAAVLAAGTVTGLSYRDAGAYWDIGDYAFPDRIDVTLPFLGSRRIPGLCVHRSRVLREDDFVVRNGIPVTSISRTLLDLSGTLGLSAMRRTFEAADRHPEFDRDELAEVIRNGRGRRGRGRLARLAGLDLSQARRTRSPLERDFLIFCKRRGLPQPLVNHVVAGFEVDAIWPASSLVVELDSWEHHQGRESFERDRSKATDLNLAGLRTLQVTSRRMEEDGDRLAETIRSLLASGEATSLHVSESRRLGLLPGSS